MSNLLYFYLSLYSNLKHTTMKIKQFLIMLLGGALAVLLFSLLSGCVSSRPCSWDKTQFSNHYQH